MTVFFGERLCWCNDKESIRQHYWRWWTQKTDIIYIYPLPSLTKFNTSKYSSRLPLAVALGNLMLQAGIIEHVMQDHGFENARYYYQFIKDKPGHGSKPLLLPSMDNIAVRYLQDLKSKKYNISWPKLLQLSTIHVLHDVTSSHL